MKTRRSSGAVLLIILGLIIAGCATTMDPKTPTADISGKWEGTWSQSTSHVRGSLALNLTQNGTEVAGNIDSGIYSLPVKGTVSGNIFRFVSPGTSLDGTLMVKDNQMTGLYISPRDTGYEIEAQLTRKKS